MNEINSSLNSFKKFLSLDDKCVELNLLEEGATGEHWDEDKNCWVINYCDRNIEYDLIHELGHIYLSEKTNYISFSNPPISENLDDNIFTVIDLLLNCFVNYNISRFDEIYTYYVEFMTDLLSKHFIFDSVLENLAFYCWFQIEYVFNLKQENHNYKFLSYIALVKGLIDVNPAIFSELSLLLHGFNDYKQSNDSQEILKFIFDITIFLCKSINYQSESFVKTQFKICFPDFEP